ncbi:hypothetical protein PLEI_1475 [Photobacterium leiognathi lrivu.4.1]|uniref:Uncharacterized protein n=1 Tax=Photobacterium leiognathi lrivu.4.1 TaxID=1248232 RepID=A0A0U1P5E9_PHOLE|nr:hypothetical protein PLEI_1475 [Photobacterium leiognathi lrivu.4.1]
MSWQRKYSKHGNPMTERERSAWRRYCKRKDISPSTVSDQEKLQLQLAFIEGMRKNNNDK